MNIRLNSSSHSQCGFTLVEIALSILVISVGLLAVFSLFPAGMAANKDSIDATYAGMFADEVLNGYRAQSHLVDWDDIQDIVVEPRSPHMWELADQQRVRANHADWLTVTYRPAALGPDAVEFGMRYKLTVDVYPGQEAHRAFAILELLPGEHGPTNNVTTFYTEFFNSRPAS